MGAVPSNLDYGGETRSGSGAQTHFRGDPPSRRLAGMVRQTKLSPSGEVDAYPLSPMQQGMLFHRLAGESRGVDVEQVICELHETIDVEKFEKAWREVIARHPALRTGFEWNDAGEPRQVVYPGEVRLALRHAEFVSETEARKGVLAYLEADRAEGFGTLRPPLLRVGLLRGGPEHYWFITTYHHLLLDARSMTILFREVLDLHDALRRGSSPDWPMPRPYRDYIDWLQARDVRGADDFFRRQLSGFSAPTSLPLARPVPLKGVEGADELAFRLPTETTGALRAAAGRHGVTLNTLAQAAWALLLSRCSGEDDVVFGAVRAGRKIPVEGVGAMVGLFINTLPVRVRCDADLPLDAWLRGLREQWVALRPHEHTPLVQVQQSSDVTPGRPLFETILSFQEPAWDAELLALGGRWSRRSFDTRAQPNFPLSVELLAGSTLTVKLIFHRSHFGARAVAQLASHYRTLLEGFASDRARRVGDVPLLTAREERRMVEEWNATTADYPRDMCVHAMVAAHAQSAPEALAVADDHGRLSYRQLNERANQLAHRLTALGVGPEACVAVCMRRSCELIVAWLGVLKAGAAFVPLDPEYPAERLAFQLQDCGARVVLTHPEVRGRLPQLAATTHVLTIPAEGSSFETEPVVDLPVRATSRALAYVIYTSGSTGQPKGVLIEHRALANLVAWHQRTYRVTPADRATHLASPAFDAAIWEIWPYLTAGASVHIPSDETRVSPALLWRWLADHRITLTFLPTPLAEAALNETWPSDLALRALLTGGDTLKRRPPADFPAQVVNHYGPTECTVVATSAVIDAVGPAGALPPIGRPIANTHAYVLDRHLRPVPVGVAGELVLGGDGLARGYLGQPELTAEKFVPHPFAAGERVYRTGDLVRWTEAGELEFLGRIDGQVKIRGCRIELGEIEAAIQAHPSVRESLVQAVTGAGGERQLCAAIVRADRRLTAADLGEYLRGKLPAYMIPAEIILVDAWPLTPNGKVDRAALLTQRVRPVSESAKTCSPLEATVGKVWAEVLGRPGVDREDNFFDLGGHSLLAAQVISRLNATLAGGLSVRALFDQPTLGAFTEEVERRIASQGEARPTGPRAKRRPARAELELVQPN